jgi:hypothetical protein
MYTCMGYIFSFILSRYPIWFFSDNLLLTLQCHGVAAFQPAGVSCVPEYSLPPSGLPWSFIPLSRNSLSHILLLDSSLLDFD